MSGERCGGRWDFAVLPAFKFGDIPFEDCFSLVGFSDRLGFGTRGHGVDLESF
jgi:hypothetical protein